MKTPSAAAPETTEPVATPSKIQALLGLSVTASEDESALAITNLQSQLAAVRAENRTLRGWHWPVEDDAEILAKVQSGLTFPQAAENLRLQRSHASPAGI